VRGVSGEKPACARYIESGLPAFAQHRQRRIAGTAGVWKKKKPLASHSGSVTPRADVALLNGEKERNGDSLGKAAESISLRTSGRWRAARRRRRREISAQSRPSGNNGSGRRRRRVFMAFDGGNLAAWRVSNGGAGGMKAWRSAHRHAAVAVKRHSLQRQWLRTFSAHAISRCISRTYRRNCSCGGSVIIVAAALCRKERKTERRKRKKIMNLAQYNIEKKKKKKKKNIWRNYSLTKKRRHLFYRKQKRRRRSSGQRCAPVGDQRRCRRRQSVGDAQENRRVLSCAASAWHRRSAGAEKHLRRRALRAPLTRRAPRRASLNASPAA